MALKWKNVEIVTSRLKGVTIEPIEHDTFGQGTRIKGITKLSIVHADDDSPCFYSTVRYCDIFLSEERILHMYSYTDQDCTQCDQYYSMNAASGILTMYPCRGNKLQIICFNISRITRGEEK